VHGGQGFRVSVLVGRMFTRSVRRSVQAAIGIEQVSTGHEKV